MKKRIVFLHDINLSDEYIRRYELHQIYDSHEVRYLYTKSADVKQNHIGYDKIKQMKLTFSNFVHISKVPSFIFITASNSFLVSLYLLLSKYFGSKIIRIYWGYYPILNEVSRYDMAKFLQFRDYYRYINNALGLALLKLFNFKNDIGLCAGGVAISKAKKESHIISNVMHWDSLGGESNASIINSDNYIVFLDENLPYHIDFSIIGWPTVNADLYFNHVNNFLNKIANQYNCTVKVAAHPKADLKLLKEKYTHQVYQGQTAALIKNSNIVVVHASTSIGIAISMMKKVIVYCDHEQRKLYRDNRLKWMIALALELSINVTYDDGEVCLSNFTNASDYVDKYMGNSRDKISDLISGIVNA